MSSRWLPATAGTRYARLAICLATLLPYAGTLNDYFVQDDFGVVWLLSQKPWSYFPRWFASTWMDEIWGFTPDEIRPFPALTYQAAAAFGAGSPLANHVINIALHAANGLLVLAVASSVAGLSLAGATVAALVFVVLPFQAESVAWITGRVDSMPAFFYLASFLLYARWRAHPARTHLYWGSVALFFVTLFSKQNAITLGPGLVLYDLVLAGTGRPDLQGGRPDLQIGHGGSRRPDLQIGPYVPFALLTLGYLALRYTLFGEVARESQLTGANVAYFGQLVVRHLRRTVFGDVRFGTAAHWALVLAAFLVAAWCATRAGRAHATRAARVAIYFGLIWWLLGVAPILVAAYESPRHIYLASVGWAVVIGLAFDLVRMQSRGRMRASAVAAALVLGFYTMQLVRTVRDWEVRSLVSERATKDLERETLAGPHGMLVFAGVPVRSWEWAMPFVTRPPFVAATVERRATVITPLLLDCCRAQWEERTRAAMRAWQAQGTDRPIVALRWDATTGARFRLSSDDEPYLRPLVQVLLDTDSQTSLDRGIVDLLDRLPPDRRLP